jgi:class 3 adenylate cyclase
MRDGQRIYQRPISSDIVGIESNGPPSSGDRLVKVLLRRMQFRIGVNLGDVMVEREQIYGDGVNVAARLENLAEPGGICISGTVYEQVRDKLALSYEDRGQQTVKNIARPVHVWRVVPDGTPSPARRLSRYWRGGVLSLTGLAVCGSF